MSKDEESLSTPARLTPSVPTSSSGARRRPYVAAASLLLVAAGAAACGSGSASSHNKADANAATVGTQTISVADLTAQVNSSLAAGKVQSQQGYTRTSFTQGLLSHLIEVDVINALASKRGVTVTPADISAQMASFVQQAGSVTALHEQAAQGGVSVSQLPAFIRFAALQEDIGKALVANLPATPAQLKTEYRKDIDQFDQLQIAQIAVPTKSLASQILAKVRAKPATFGALAAKDSTDSATKTKGGLVGYVGRSQVIKVLDGHAAAAKPGSFAIGGVKGQYVVVHVISRKLQPISQVTAQLKTALFAKQASAMIEKAAAAEATTLGVHVNPIYGVWDNATQEVVPKGTPTSAPTPSATPAATAPASASSGCLTISPDPVAKGEPYIPQVSGKPPTKLVTKDITVGHGQAAKAGDNIVVQYVGVSCSTGKAFDASYTDGAKNKDFAFALGAGRVIAGWDQGIVGMKVGGVRELIIPAALGYGAAGSPPAIAPDETLIFVVHLVKV